MEKNHLDIRLMKTTHDLTQSNLNDRKKEMLLGSGGLNSVIYIFGYFFLVTWSGDFGEWLLNTFYSIVGA